MAEYKVGDHVLVDAGVFTASPERGRGFFECEVLEDSNPSQTYVCRVDRGSPLYVFNKDIKPAMAKGVDR